MPCTAGFCKTHFMFKKAFQSLRIRFGILADLFDFLAHNKSWWLIPMVAILLLFFLVIILGGSTPLGPFIYTIL